ncbi:MAG: hypothetical protein Q9164_007478 [Protoblastenia rupestris]
MAEFGYDYLLPSAVDMEFFYVSSSTEPATMTLSLKYMPTHTYDNAPRDLDILLVGGPQLSHRPEASLRFIKEVCEDKKEKVVMSTCLGGLWIADAGVLKGTKATTNRGAITVAKQLHSDVDWVDQRWVVSKSGHLNFWTSGGAGAGIDMLATYVKDHFPEAIAMSAWDALDFDPTARGQFYKGPLSKWLDPAGKA